ncbi:SusC/RagA family TonB-linked outer membrane protein [Ginsengibacter hankyongi]|uniref:SusC/RagA family TonB-linked outer membrane protein n=1 Tax=Ginsengibacter hankyongi TaxID=2607284 RepID=A0A5J5IG10_9BACT|nr:SusC/RagA family TonB-linked outer membrane protein [Ginsengibacter hankyongi]KAA9038739.1 SusC/RagA family TonB-linked outer membrane protein [Ginsengibacter hankyongi]
MKITTAVLITFFLIGHAMAQRNIRLSGTVSSRTGNRLLPGATITVKGTTFSTITGASGDFVIPVQQHQVLVVTHVGFISREIRVDSVSETPLSVILTESVVELNDVTVSTGYQEFDKKSATGSYEQIDKALLNRSTGTSILSRLDGIAPSVFFDHRNNADAPVQIRGISTLGLASTAPLIILDHFPYEGDINNINPNDIESITILKDAAASAIWGARAGNGVIVLTSKKGQLNQHSRLSFTTNLIYTARPDLFTKKDMSPSEYIDVEQLLFKQGYYDGVINDPYNYTPVSPVVQILAKQQSGAISDADANAQINALRKQDVRKDFEKYLYRPDVTRQYGLNLSGGGNNFTYLISGGYDCNTATLVGNRDDRINVRSENTLIPIKNLQLDFGAGYTRINSYNNSPGGYGNITVAGGRALYPYSRLADDFGNPLPVDILYSSNFTDTAGGGILLDWKYRPLDELKNVTRNTVSDALIADLGIKFNLSRSLNAEVRYQYQNTQNNSSNIYNVNSFDARNFINEFTQFDGAIAKYIVPYGGILDGASSSLKGYALRGQVNFNTVYHTRHALNAIAGAEVRQTGITGNNYRVYGYDDKLNNINVDYVNAYPTFDNIFGDAYIPGGSTFSGTLERYTSLYANADYTYNRKYTISASFRKDASNLFGVNANQKAIPLWSAGAAWNISGEGFYHLKWLPFLKLRATYGYGGNVSHTVAALATLRYNPANYQPITNLPFAVISNYPNPDLQWEKVGTTNIGMDFGTQDDRITGSIEYFQKNSTDLLGQKLLDPTLGISYLFTNSANLKGHGADVMLRSKNTDTKNFKWETSFYLSYIKNKVTRYLYNQFTDGLVSDGLTITPLAGYEPYQIISFKWGGLNTSGDPVGYINGKPSTNYDSLVATPLNDQSIDGSAVPHCFGAVRNSFTYKRLSVSVNITYRLGYYFRKPALNYYSLFNNGQGNIEYAQRWQHPGDERKTNVPALVTLIMITATSFTSMLK